MGNPVLAVGRDLSNSVAMRAHQPPLFCGSARAVGCGGAGCSATDPPRLGHRPEFDRSIPASTGARDGFYFGDDGSGAGCAIAAGIRLIDGGILRARHHGRIRRILLPVSAMEAKTSERDEAAAARGNGGAVVALGMDFRARLRCLAASGGYASLLFCAALALVRVVGRDCSPGASVVVPRTGAA